MGVFWIWRFVFRDAKAVLMILAQHGIGKHQGLDDFNLR